jgi:ring-1,2-phenylacetyl-CoA epoxidase subunit PaaE
MLTFHELTLRERARIAEEAFALTLEIPHAARASFACLPGQHVVVRATVNGRALRRNYSVVGPVRAELVIGVRSQGEMSRYLAEELPLGARLEVLSPGGGFHAKTDAQHAKRYVAISAGSGITPVLSIAQALLEEEPRSELVLLYCNRSLARVMFLEEVLALKNRYPARCAVHFVMTREPQEVELYNGRLDGSRLAAFPGRLLEPGEVDEYFLCGPQAMVDELAASLRAHEVTAPIHIERFGGARAGAPVLERSAVIPEVPPASESLATTEVSVVMDGRRRGFTMRRDGERVLEAAERAGLELPFACRAGVCSTCRARLLAGEVTMDYNQALEPAEVAAGYVLCCQARALSARLELTYDM